MKYDLPPKPEAPNQKPETFLGEFITHAPEETFAVAKRIGEQLKGGEIFLLTGDLGAGKTVFAKGLAAGLGIDPADVTSPSFTLINIHEGRLRFHHVDLYRVDIGADQNLGLEEIFEDTNAVTVVEWASRLGFIPSRAIKLRMLYISDSERMIRID